MDVIFKIEPHVVFSLLHCEKDWNHELVLHVAFALGTKLQDSSHIFANKYAHHHVQTTGWSREG